MRRCGMACPCIMFARFPLTSIVHFTGEPLRLPLRAFAKQIFVVTELRPPAPAAACAGLHTSLMAGKRGRRGPSLAVLPLALLATLIVLSQRKWNAGGAVSRIPQPGAHRVAAQQAATAPASPPPAACPPPARCRSL